MIFTGIRWRFAFGWYIAYFRRRTRGVFNDFRYTFDYNRFFDWGFLAFDNFRFWRWFWTCFLFFTWFLFIFFPFFVFFSFCFFNDFRFGFVKGRLFNFESCVKYFNISVPAFCCQYKYLFPVREFLFRLIFRKAFGIGTCIFVRIRICGCRLRKMIWIDLPFRRLQIETYRWMYRSIPYLNKHKLSPLSILDENRSFFRVFYS